MVLAVMAARSGGALRSSRSPAAPRSGDRSAPAAFFHRPLPPATDDSGGNRTRPLVYASYAPTRSRGECLSICGRAQQIWEGCAHATCSPPTAVTAIGRGAIWPDRDWADPSWSDRFWAAPLPRRARPSRNHIAACRAAAGRGQLAAPPIRHVGDLFARGFAAADDQQHAARPSKAKCSPGEDRFIPGWCHRNAARALRNHGGDEVMRAHPDSCRPRRHGRRDAVIFSPKLAIFTPLKLGEDDFLSH